MSQRDLTSSRRGGRLVVPVVLVLVWLIVAGLGGPYFGKISEVSSNDRTSFLPTTAESTRVQGLLDRFLGSDTIPAVVVASRPGGLTAADLAALKAAADTTIAGVSQGRSPAIPSEDGVAAQIFVPISTDADLKNTVNALLRVYQSAVGDQVTIQVTGPAGFAADLSTAFAGIDGLFSDNPREAIPAVKEGASR